MEQSPRPTSVQVALVAVGSPYVPNPAVEVKSVHRWVAVIPLAAVPVQAEVESRTASPAAWRWMAVAGPSSRSTTFAATNAAASGPPLIGSTRYQGPPAAKTVGAF